MKSNTLKSKEIIYVVIISIIFYIVNRASSDLPVHRDYYETKSLLFFIVDITSTIIAAIIIDYAINKLTIFYTSNKRGIILEYLSVLVFVIPFCYLFAFCRGMLIRGEMYSIDKIFVAIILASLFSCLYYAYKKQNIENENRQYLLDKQAELKHEKLQTELEALRSQYHPHFLFNALNTIYFLIDPNNAKARMSVELLSDILRYQVKCGGDMVPLKYELKYLEKDIEMRKLRSSNNLNLKLKLDYIDENINIYPLLFTPIIENAFKYVGGKYLINISIQITDNILIFSVINSLPEYYDENERVDGTGIINLKRRLNILYPNKHILEQSIYEDQYNTKLKIDLL